MVNIVWHYCCFPRELRVQTQGVMTREGVMAGGERWVGNQRGMTILDTLITLSLIAILIWVAFPRYERLAVEAQKVALRNELGGIRLALQLYKIRNNRYPADLRVLLKEQYLWPTGQEPGKEGAIFKQAYLEAQSLDVEGHLLDPFGNRIAYNPQTGRVWSQTKGYEAW